MTIETHGLGWLRDNPDHRDHIAGAHDFINDFHRRSALPLLDGKLPAEVDLSEYCSPIEYQGTLGSCTAHTGTALLEYFENRAYGAYTRASRLFLYKAARDLAQATGDVGAQLRTIMKAMVQFGIPPEQYWPYVIEEFDKEPTAFCYSYAANFKSIVYYRLDANDVTGQDLVDQIKRYLASGYPSMFGFSLYNRGNDKGEFAYPGPKQKLIGGHALVNVGYDDSRSIDDEVGAFKVRNSWGTDWGDKGYGWLPYKYAAAGLAADFWSLLRAEYLDEGAFAESS